MEMWKLCMLFYYYCFVKLFYSHVIIQGIYCKFSSLTLHMTEISKWFLNSISKWSPLFRFAYPVETPYSMNILNFYSSLEQLYWKLRWVREHSCAAESCGMLMFYMNHPRCSFHRIVFPLGVCTISCHKPLTVLVRYSLTLWDTQLYLSFCICHMVILHNKSKNASYP